MSVSIVYVSYTPTHICTRTKMCIHTQTQSISLSLCLSLIHTHTHTHTHSSTIPFSLHLTSFARHLKSRQEGTNTGCLSDFVVENKSQVNATSSSVTHFLSASNLHDSVVTSLLRIGTRFLGTLVTNLVDPVSQ